jgi:serine phosphatase RsbU (regulator of sigma subunit)
LPRAIRDHFVIWKPKDIIGGDIFWLHKQGHRFIAAVIDCTGHGVPGAIMTMIANMALNRVVQDISDDDPAAVLKELNRLVRISLGQHIPGSSTDDGLDVGLCVVNPAARTLIFAGARIGMLVAEKGMIKEIKGDRKSLGYRTSNPDHDFTNHRLALEEGTAIYLTTDGIFDQVGGSRRLPFGKRRFMEVVAAHGQEAMSMQKEAIEEALTAYQGSEEQRDDITVVGFVV